MHTDIRNNWQSDLQFTDYTSSDKEQQEYLGRMFPPLVLDDDDPFNIFNIQIQSETKSSYYSELSLSIELGIQMLTSGNEELLIKNYYQKYKQNENQLEKIKQKFMCFQKADKQGDSKNIPKNFGKQLIKFIKKNPVSVQKVLKSMNSLVKYDDLNYDCQKRKRTMSKIGDLQDLWLDKNRFAKEMRILAQNFLRKWSRKWIFNSRITDYTSHLKYCRILSKLIQKPSQIINLRFNFEQHQRAIQ